MHVEIPWYQVQKMNINQIKENFRIIKTSVRYKHILYERLLTALKEKAPLYVEEQGLTNNQENKKEDTSMNSFP